MYTGIIIIHYQFSVCVIQISVDLVNLFNTRCFYYQYFDFYTMDKRKIQSGASKHSTKRRNDLIACGLLPNQQKLNFFFRKYIITIITN